MEKRIQHPKIDFAYKLLNKKGAWCSFCDGEVAYIENLWEENRYECLNCGMKIVLESVY